MTSGQQDIDPGLDYCLRSSAAAPARKSALRIAYVGPSAGVSGGTSLQRARALERLGHDVALVDPFDYIGHSVWAGRWLHHAGAFGLGLKIDRPIFKAVAQSRPDLIWVDQGAYLGASLIAKFRSLCVPIANYTLDDPFGGRDGRRFARYFEALPFYDLLAVVREENVAEAYARGARKVLRVWMSADEVAHRPRRFTEEDRRKWGSEVCFAGTWMPERGPFMAELVRAGLPLSLWGDRWQKAPEWPLLAPHWRGPGQADPEIYARIMQGAKICLGLLSKGNRDRHTTRSFEIPASGGLLCAERTDEHCAAYKDGVEAVFWDDANECIAQCRRLLQDEALAESIRRAGHRRYLDGGHKNESVLGSILADEALAGGWK